MPCVVCLPFASAAEELRAWPSAPTDGPVQLYLAGVTALGSLHSSLPAALLDSALEYGEGVALLLRCPGLLPRLWALWELLLCGRPLLVHSASAALCSEATLGLGARGEGPVVAGPWDHNRSVPVCACAKAP